MARNQNGRNSRETIPHCIGKGQTIAARHLNIADDQIDAATKVLDDFQSAGTVFSFQGLKIVLSQNSRHIHPNSGLVVNNKGKRHIWIDNANDQALQTKRSYVDGSFGLIRGLNLVANVASRLSSWRWPSSQPNLKSLFSSSEVSCDSGLGRGRRGAVVPDGAGDSG